VLPPDPPSRKEGAAMRATVMYGAGDVRVEREAITVMVEL
jgi:hypothetical protein